MAQSELDIYLSRHNTAVTQLNTAKQSLQTTTDTLRDRRTAIKELQVNIPQCEQELKKVRWCVCGRVSNVEWVHKVRGGLWDLSQ